MRLRTISQRGEPGDGAMRVQTGPGREPIVSTEVLFKHENHELYIKMKQFLIINVGPATKQPPTNAGPKAKQPPAAQPPQAQQKKRSLFRIFQPIHNYSSRKNEKIETPFHLKH